MLTEIVTSHIICMFTLAWLISLACSKCVTNPVMAMLTNSCEADWCTIPFYFLCCISMVSFSCIFKASYRCIHVNSRLATLERGILRTFTQDTCPCFKYTRRISRRLKPMSLYWKEFVEKIAFINAQLFYHLSSVSLDNFTLNICLWEFITKNNETILLISENLNILANNTCLKHPPHYWPFKAKLEIAYGPYSSNYSTLKTSHVLADREAKRAVDTHNDTHSESLSVLCWVSMRLAIHSSRVRGLCRGLRGDPIWKFYDIRWKLRVTSRY